ncbi:MAG: transketolase C-terminal domain-containing protein [Planctomycetota bacterium]
MAERMVENLNRALQASLAANPSTYLVGEDLVDPYGGAFKAAKGLSTQFPQQVISTPISEEGLLAFANGLALCGDRAIAEIMFGDFAALGFDQILNVAAKTVSMYGKRRRHNLIVRIPVGGHRGYGATHSQSLQKHFIGIPDLELHELSPFHDSTDVFEAMWASDKPCLHFESKVLYTQDFIGAPATAGRLRVDMLEGGVARAFLPDAGVPEALILTHGSCALMALEAARELFVEHEIVAEVLVPSRLYPFAETLPLLTSSPARVFTVEECVAGGTWGESLAAHLQRQQPGREPVITLASLAAVIPSAPLLEKQVLVSKDRIVDEIRRVLRP